MKPAGVDYLGLKQFKTGDYSGSNKGTKRKHAAVVGYTNNTRVRYNGYGSLKLEKKFLDFSAQVGIGNGYLLGGTGTLSLLNGCATGSTATTRTGREIKIKAIYINGSVSVQPTTSGSGYLRTIIFIDFQTNATTPTITDLLVNDAADSLSNLNNRKRFKIIMDQRDIIGGIVTGVGEPGTVIINRYVKCNYRTEFNGNSAGVVSDITKGSIYLLTYMGGNIITAGVVPIINTRVRFQD